MLDPATRAVLDERAALLDVLAAAARAHRPTGPLLRHGLLACACGAVLPDELHDHHAAAALVAALTAYVDQEDPPA